MSLAARAWTDRSPRERTAIAWIAGIAVVALFIAYAWLPLERARTRLSTQLPELRVSLATLEREADEVRRLRARPPVAATTAEPLVSIATAAGGNPLPGARISVLDGRTLVVSGSDVAFGALLEWLASVQARQGLRVESARIEALPARGRVRAELRLSRA